MEEGEEERSEKSLWGGGGREEEGMPCARPALAFTRSLRVHRTDLSRTLPSKQYLLHKHFQSYE